MGLGRTAHKIVSSVDSRAEDATAPLRGHRVVQVSRLVSHSGDGGAVWLVLLALQSKKNPGGFLRAAASLAVAAAVVNGPIKALTRRPRPEPLAKAPQPPGSSFPSGHAFSSAMIAGLIPPGNPLRGVAIPLAGAVALSRVHLRYHHLSDVAAGAAAGAAVGVALRGLVKLSPRA
jgi:undecaprenyl-diphosphatase